MKKEIRRVDPSRNIVCVTTTGERWYSKVEIDPNTGLDIINYRPSVTWIVGFYPKGKGFETWLKNNGSDADIIAQVAAEHGYKEHRAIARLNSGESVRADQLMERQTDDGPEEMDTEEWAGVCSYVQWWETEGKQRFKILRCEFTTWPDAQRLTSETGLPAEAFMYAGTIDIEAMERSTGLRWIIDVKRSKAVYPSHEMQVNAYRVAEHADRQAILQINYTRNKYQKWKFTEVPDKFSLFRATKAIWWNETADISPLQRDFPMELKLDMGDA